MRRLLVALGLMGLLSPAFAADYELPGPVPVLPASSTPTYVVGPPPICVFTWTGCYAGVHAGGASVDNQFNGQFSDTIIPTGVNATPVDRVERVSGGGLSRPSDRSNPTLPSGKGFISSNSINVGNARRRFGRRSSGLRCSVRETLGRRFQRRRCRGEHHRKHGTNKLLQPYWPVAGHDIRQFKRQPQCSN